MRKLKIVTIGGGSSYTPELIEGIINRYKSLPVTELWLVDCEEGKHKLEVVGNLAKRMIKKAGIPIDLHMTLNRKEALQHADFVITQLRVGLLEARIKDERIPLKHGLIGQETNGAGGLFKALRTIPVILDICQDMKNLCPEAWLINFTNPAGIVTEAVNRYSPIKKVIGLCNVPVGMQKAIADILETDMENIKVRFGGLNHMVYATEIKMNGENKMPYVLNRWGAQSMSNIKGIEWQNAFIKELGVIPSPYHRYYYMSKETLEDELEKFKENGTRAEIVKKVEDELFELYKDETLEKKPELLEKRGGAYYSNAACNLIDSIYNDRGDIQVVNTLNRGAMEEFEYDEVVEMSCIINKSGPIPLTVGKLPKATKGLVQQIKSFELAACEAAVTGDYNKALLALMINPLVQSQRYALVVLNELLEVHKKYLPRFYNKQ